MKHWTTFIFTLTIPIFTLIPYPSQAQTNQTLGECINEVRRNSYNINSRDAALSCINVLQYQQAKENLGQCINGVRRNSYNVSSQEANQLCQSLLEQQLKNNRDCHQITPKKNSDNFQPQPQRRTQRQCVHIASNQVADNPLCGGRSRMFEWRTIYLD